MTAEAAEVQIAQIDQAFNVATAVEARELAEERGGLETSRAIAAANAARMKEQIAAQESLNSHVSEAAAALAAAEAAEDYARCVKLVAALERMPKTLAEVERARRA